MSEVTPKLSLCTEKFIIVALEKSSGMLKIIHETIRDPIHNLFCQLTLFRHLIVVENFFLLVKLDLNYVGNNL